LLEPHGYGPSAPFCFFVSSGATSCDQRLRSRPFRAELLNGDRATKLSLPSLDHVPIKIREIESRDDNVSGEIRAQSRKETEFFELMWRLLARAHSRSRCAMA
jgi:hypothetical protein